MSQLAEAPNYQEQTVLAEAAAVAAPGVDPQYLHNLDLLVAGETDAAQKAESLTIRIRNGKAEQEALIEEVRANKPDVREQRVFINANEDSPRVETPEIMKVFEIWFNNRCSIKTTAEQLGMGHRTINRYREWFGWDQRARDRFALANKIAEEQGTAQLAKMIERHYAIGEKLLDRVEEFVDTAEIDSYRDAISAAKLGVELQRQAKQMPDWIVSVKHGTTDELKAQLRQITDARRRSLGGGDYSGAEGERGADGYGRRDDIIDVECVAGETREGLLEVSEGSDRICD